MAGSSAEIALIGWNCFPAIAHGELQMHALENGIRQIHSFHKIVPRNAHSLEALAHVPSPSGFST